MQKQLKDMTIDEWQRLLSEYRNTKLTPAAMRIENTPFTVGRYAGGMTYGGETYTYVEPPTGGKNPDGTPEVAWLMVRNDFMAWAAKQRRKGGAA